MTEGDGTTFHTADEGMADSAVPLGLEEATDLSAGLDDGESDRLGQGCVMNLLTAITQGKLEFLIYSPPSQSIHRR